MTEDITQSDEFKAALAEQRTGLDAKNKELLDEVKAARKALKRFDGFDPDTFAELQAAHEKAEDDKAKAEGDWEKLQAKQEKKVAELNSIIADQDTRFRGVNKERDAALAIGEHEGNPTLLLPIVREALQVDDEYNVYAEVDGDKLSASAYVKHLRADDRYSGAFTGTGAGGAGSKPAGDNTPPGTEFPGVEFLT